jgi:hypothetical protein
MPGQPMRHLAFYAAAVVGRSLRRLLLFGSLLGLTATSAFAAGKKAAAPAESAPEVSYPVVDWLIVVVLIGLAVFVVCRTSRRT